MTDFYDNTVTGGQLWTAGFLNERFPEPVSPLGWTLIARLFEELALRAPLRYLGVVWPAERPFTRLYNGHPYVDAQVFWSIYKPFPGFALPEDAVRYFPGEEIALRETAPGPAGLHDPRLWFHVARSFASDAANWSPWHNWRAWKRFEPVFLTELGALQQRIAGAVRPEGAHALMRDLLELNGRLLRLHRWSLTHADVSFTLLRRLLRTTHDEASANELAARLVSGVPNLSLELNHDLQRLASLRHQAPSRLEGELHEFLLRHGHRSFSLDVRRPPFQAEPVQILDLLDDPALSIENARQLNNLDRNPEERWAGLAGFPARAAFHEVLRLARVYMGLREDQRYRWQQALALVRRVALSAGADWVARGELDSADDVFFVTISEWERRASGAGSLPERELIRARSARLLELQRDYTACPARHYPAFLRGDAPLIPGRPDPGSRVYRGRAASPGVARGPVHRVCAPEGLSTVGSGEVLVARTTDPAWTPVFARISALVTETGGLLSHGAVVAREYGVPAVVAVDAIYDSVSDGELIEVDGGSGTVSVLSRRNQPVG